jgi:hypothetical protein
MGVNVRGHALVVLLLAGVGAFLVWAVISAAPWSKEASIPTSENDCKFVVLDSSTGSDKSDLENNLNLSLVSPKRVVALYDHSGRVGILWEGTGENILNYEIYRLLRGGEDSEEWQYFDTVMVTDINKQKYEYNVENGVNYEYGVRSIGVTGSCSKLVPADVVVEDVD